MLEGEKKIVSSEEEGYRPLIDEKQNPKPHLPKYSLVIKSVEDIKYIIVKTDVERKTVFETLRQIFDSEAVLAAVISGRLMILTDEQVRNDF
jgi:hypothetical protein